MDDDGEKSGFSSRLFSTFDYQRVTRDLDDLRTETKTKTDINIRFINKVGLPIYIYI